MKELIRVCIMVAVTLSALVFTFRGAARVSNKALKDEVERHTATLPASPSYEQRLAKAVETSEPYALNVDQWNYTVYFTKREPGNRMVVNFCLTNNASHSRRIPTVKVADATGAVHSANPEVTLLQSINPGIAMALEATFVVPDGREYALMVEGAMETRLIRLLEVE